MVTLLSILLPAIALAHTPHDVIYALAAPEALDDSAPWVTMVFHSNFVSEDAGRNWDTVGGETALFTPVGGGILADGTIVLCSKDDVYTSVNGADWTPTPTATSINSCAVREDEVVTGGNFGIHAGPATGPFALVSDTPTSFLKVNNGWVTAITTTNEVIFGATSGYWMTASSPGETLSSAVASDIGTEITVYAGTESGLVLYWTSTDGWSTCGALPTMARPNVVQIDITASHIVVGPAERGPFVSEDKCGTWLERTTGADTEFSPISGGASSDQEAVSVLEISGDRIITAGWAGMFQSDDAGLSWRESPLGAADRCRDVAFAPDFSTSGRLYISTLAGGLLITTDGGASATSPMLGAGGSYVAGVSVPPDNTDQVWAIINNVAWFSYDQGKHWVQIETPYDDTFSVAALEAFGTDDIWVSSWAQSTDPARQGIHAFSADGGVSWQDLAVLEQVLPNASSVTRIDQSKGHRYCAGAMGGMACSDDPLTTWSKIEDIESPAQRWHFAYYPQIDPTHVVAVNSSGETYLSTDQAQTFTETFSLSNDNWVGVAFTETGELFGATDKGYIYESTDYTNWSEVAYVPSWPTGVSPHPNFSETPELIVPTYTGPYVVDLSSGSADVARLGGIERIVSGSGFLQCPDCGASSGVSSDDATLGTAIRLVEGLTLDLPVRGHTITIVGKIDGDGEALVQIDETEYLIQGDVTEAYEEILVVDGLSDSYHYVHIEGLAGGDIIFDYIDGVSEADLLSVPTTNTATTETADTSTTFTTETDGTDAPDTGVDNGTCGCASNQSSPFSWFWLLAVLPLIARRRLVA